MFLSVQLTNCHKNIIEKETKVKKMRSWESDTSGSPFHKVGQLQ